MESCLRTGENTDKRGGVTNRARGRPFRRGSRRETGGFKPGDWPAVHDATDPGVPPGLFPGKNRSPGMSNGVAGAALISDDRKFMKTNLNPILRIPVQPDLCMDEVQAAVSNGFKVAIFARGANEAAQYAQPDARVVAMKEVTQRSPDAPRIYTCRNCGGRMKLPESATACAPSCPVCGRPVSHFDI